MLAADPVGTSCGTCGLIKSAGRGTWADADCMGISAHRKRMNRRNCSFTDRTVMAPRLRHRLCAAGFVLMKTCQDRGGPSSVRPMANPHLQRKIQTHALPVDDLQCQTL